MGFISRPIRARVMQIPAGYLPYYAAAGCSDPAMPRVAAYLAGFKNSTQNPRKLDPHKKVLRGYGFRKQVKAGLPICACGEGEGDARWGNEASCGLERRTSMCGALTGMFVVFAQKRGNSPWSRCI